MITPAMTFPNMTRLARLRSWRLLLALLLAGTATFASAQERPRRAPAPQSEQHPETRPPEQRAADTRDSVLRLLPPDWIVCAPAGMSILAELPIVVMMPLLRISV